MSTVTLGHKNDPIADVVARYEARRGQIEHAARSGQGSLRLRDYVKAAWPILEPARKLVSAWHVDCLAEHLEAVSRGELKRLLINVPPRATKSRSVAVFWPTWDWTADPWRRWLFNSYSQPLSLRDALAARRLIESAWYQSRWGHVYQLTDDQNRKERYDTTKTGFRVSTSVNGTNTGEGADISVADDPHNVKEGESDLERRNVISWWSETMASRVTDFESHARVIVMQRVHEDDLAGYVLKEGGYHHLNLPGERETPTFVEGADFATILEPDGPGTVDTRFPAAAGADGADGPEASVTPTLAAAAPSATIAAADGRDANGTPEPRAAAGPDGANGHPSAGAQTPIAFAPSGPTDPPGSVRDPVKPQPHDWCPIYPDPRAVGETLDPVRFSPAVLAGLLAELKPYGYAGQVQQRPVPREGAVFKDSYFRPLPPDFDLPGVGGLSPRQRLLKVVHFDLNYSARGVGDHAAAAVVGIDPAWNVYVLHVWRVLVPEHALPEESALFVRTLRPPSRPSVVSVEQAAYRALPTQNWVRLFRQITRVFGLQLAILPPKTPTGDKVSRARVVADIGQIGQLFADRGAPWWRVFVNEATSFPKSQEDDQVDALSGAVQQAMELLAQQPSGEVSRQYLLGQASEATEGEDWLDAVFDGRTRKPNGTLVRS